MPRRGAALASASLPAALAPSNFPPAPALPADQPEKAGPPVLALFQHGLGRVGLYGDSNCLDSSHSRSNCFDLLAAMLKWAAGEVRAGAGGAAGAGGSSGL